jgi:hypothetical protein
MEDFLKGQFHTEIKQHLGETIFKEIHAKVTHLIEIKNQKTASPLKTA